MLVGALWLLHNELKQYDLKDFLNGFAEIPAPHLWLAVALTVLDYLILVGYDILGVKYVGRPMHLAKVALGSCLGYAVGNIFGTLFGGSSIRHRLYSSWGLSAVDIVKLLLILGVTSWIGLFALAGFVFIWEPLEIPSQLFLPVSNTRPLGIVLASLAIGYLALGAMRRTPVKIWKWDFTPPPLGLLLMQYLVATLDLLVASSVLYVLLPETVATGYWQFLVIYLVALAAAFITQVPGGLGVLELVIIALLNPSEPPSVMGALFAYRAIYYLGPLAVALVLLGGHEISLPGKSAQTAFGQLGKWTPVIAPRVMAFTVFLAGATLLFSGATPAAEGRMALVRRMLPLPLIEVSHFVGSLIGVMLLILARGLQRRIETAYYLTIALLVGGIMASLLKGFEYEEAIILGVMLAVFVPCKRHFYRKGALLTERFTPRWIIAILGVLACTAWIMSFAFKHVDYQDDLWWQFAFSNDAPRSLRAMAGAVIATMVVLTVRVLRSKGRLGAMPTEQDLEDVRKIVRQSPKVASNLALLGDKRFLFNDDRTAFVMYGEEGQSYISMGDPVGPKEAAVGLAWDFRELCDVTGHTPVFYEVDEDNVSLYVEMGLPLIKIGEEARVRLQGFGLEGRTRRALRRTNKQLTDEGCQFEIVEPPAVSELMPTLKGISDAWLGDKNTAEKGFSLGFFEADYICRSPVAIIWHESRVVAFANLRFGANKEELSADLMRYIPGSPDGVIEFLFIRLMLWGNENGYQWFSLGIAPLAGIEPQPLGPIWNQLASLTFRHGEHFYNFQGLRQYKDKFDPEWKGKYIASPGGLTLPITLANIATLISGGIGALIRK